MKTEELLNKFDELFQGRDGRLFFSPGRINLIGEHTDYNGGHVFPCAITFGTYGVARKREDREVRLYSLNFPEQGTITFSLDDLHYEENDGWGNYPKGMIHYIKQGGWTLPSGLDLMIYGNIPNGAGLSSSASLEMLIGVIVSEMFQLHIDRLKLVSLGKKVENEFIGVQSGIMDQFAVGMGKKDCGILLDCNTLTYKYMPLNLEDHQIIIMNTNKRRELADSKYNERRGECESALYRLQKSLSIESLGDLTESEFEQHRYLINDEVLEKRAKHAVYENQRILRAFQTLEHGGLASFGSYMNESHRSLRDDYEVTGIELDTLVEAAWKRDGTVGARMTGAGFGGCAIAIVRENKTEEFIRVVGEEYARKIGYEATFYVANIGEGAKEITQEVLR
ncbi:galactokinase [Priestia filamentosa]|uniref:galactokinase n=1 Tax=Priestia filamentosa TaxID=1402861 RepID=UPI000A08B47F|nr:galactokinase [Priestia filamentosa]OXS72130.1 galactokinase [Priestia filamentosa]WRU94315.1 galactokinase [Priestia filamentosa]SMF11411.1 galactokinase [Priestia filamentosa]